ncbi:MAG: hypothetical protein GXO78_15150 [Calditrichaeota bacterium]|nr:hypothetical protein [Calditrichota bacterium]
MNFRRFPHWPVFWIIGLSLCGLLLAGPPDRTSKLRRIIDWSGEEALHARIYVGTGLFYLMPGSSKRIMEGEFLFRKIPPKISYEVVGDKGQLRIRFTDKPSKKKEEDEDQSTNISSLDEIYENECNLRFTPNIPISLILEFGVVKGEVELGGLQMEKLKLSVGVSGLDVNFQKPNPIIMEEIEVEAGVGKLQLENLGNANFSYFKFDGGLGSYEVDLSGDFRQNADVDINLGLGKLLLYLPRSIGVRLKVNKSFLTSFSIDDVYKKNNYYFNENWGKAPYSMDIRIDAGIGRISIEWVD